MACWCAICKGWRRWPGSIPWSLTKPVRWPATAWRCGPCTRRLAGGLTRLWRWRQRWRGTPCTPAGGPWGGGGGGGAGGAGGRGRLADGKEEAGLGLRATVQDGAGAVRIVRLGSARHAGLAAQQDSSAPQVLLSEQGPDGAVLELARFDLVEALRCEAAAVVQALERQGLSVQLLSGDRIGAVQRVAALAGIATDRAQGDCTPQGKLAALQALQAGGRHVAMVGDGLNDGPVLAGA